MVGERDEVRGRDQIKALVKANTPTHFSPVTHTEQERLSANSLSLSLSLSSSFTACTLTEMKAIISIGKTLHDNRDDQFLLLRLLEVTCCSN